MKPNNILRQLNLASFIMLACAIYCAYVSFDYVTVNANKFFIVVGGFTSVMLGFAVVLNVMNIFMMPRDKFYSNGAMTFHVISGILLCLSIVMPEQYFINFISICVFSIFNIFVFLSTMTFRSNESTLINQLRELFPTEKSFSFDIDFKFKKDFIKDAVGTYNYGICLLTPFGKVVFVGDKFYFDDSFHEAKRFATNLKDCGFKFNKATPDEMKVVEMHVY